VLVAATALVAVVAGLAAAGVTLAAVFLDGLAFATLFTGAAPALTGVFLVTILVSSAIVSHSPLVR
jgi:hypothetical protein